MCHKILIIRFNCGCCIKTDGMPLFIDPCEMSRWWNPASGLPSDYLDLCIFHPKDPQRPVKRTMFDLSLGYHGFHIGCLFHLYNKEYASWNEWLEAVTTNFVVNDHLIRFAHLLGFERRNGAFVQRPYSYLKIAYTKDVLLDGTMIRSGEECIPILGLRPPPSQGIAQPAHQGPYSTVGSAYRTHT